jgi:hypothetical protein
MVTDREQNNGKQGRPWGQRTLGYYDGIRTEFFPFIARALAPGESSLVAATSLGPFPQSLWMTE